MSNGSPLHDVVAHDEGTVWLLGPRSNAGERWLDENLDPETPRFGPFWAIGWRYVADIIEGLQSAGLVVTKGG